MTGAYLSIRARGQLSISPRLQQASRLLQVSSTELQQELRAAIANNPFLEEDEDSPAANEPESEALPTEQPLDIPRLTSDATTSRATPRGEEMGDPVDRAFQLPSLRDHLRAQICGSSCSMRERIALELLIESIDDDGYLRISPAEAAQTLEIEPALREEDFSAALRTLQSFDPSGVGARSPSECLLLQIKHGEPDTPGSVLAATIVSDYLPALARRDFGLLRLKLGCTDEDLRAAVALIRRLDPHPGERYSQILADYVVPDVIVTIEEGRLRTCINPAVLPRAHVNSSYANLLRQTGNESHSGLRQELREARWLMRNIEQRFNTIQRVAETIVRHQRAFFMYGDVALKPMIMRDVADELSLHESTISRATGRKYMATPRGTFEFKHFFSRKLSTGTGGRCSATAVRALILEMVDDENRDSPLSDVELAQKLVEQGICIARRTVTKYRTMMKVPPAELRKAS